MGQIEMQNTFHLYFFGLIIIIATTIGGVLMFKTNLLEGSAQNQGISKTKLYLSGSREYKDTFLRQQEQQSIKVLSSFALFFQGSLNFD